MNIKKIAGIGILMSCLFTIALPAQSVQTDEERFVFVFGPRVGVSWRFMSGADFTNEVQLIFPEGNYFPVFSLFGALAEQRFLLGETESHFVIQEVLLIAALEQSIALPTGVVLIGYRSSSGFEFGVGPTVSFSGMGVVLAVGYTFSYRGVYIPVDLSWIIPNQSTLGGVALTTGFNFRLD